MLEAQRGLRNAGTAEAEPAAGAPFQLKGSSFKLMVLRVSDPAHPELFTRLAAQVAQAPSFFHRVPLVLDFQDAPAMSLDLARFCAQLRGLELMPVGVQGVSAELAHAAYAAGLPVIPTGRAGSPRIEGKTGEHPAPKEEPRTPLVITEPVRSGRQVYAPKTDLIVLAPVSPGAELLADGHIHVYDTLRGRALAGLSGDRSARIFCRKLEAELVSIAGLYKVSEDIDRNCWKSSAQIHLVADRLCFTRLP